MIDRMYNKRDSKWYTTDDHQHVAYDHLYTNRRAALFLGMSLSKTVVALSYLYDMHYREAAITKTLVIAPDKVARITWPNEIETWQHLEGMRYSLVAGTAKQRLKALQADAEVYIVSVDNIVWLIEQYLTKKNGKYTGKLPFDCVLLDESDYFKSRSSNRFKKLQRAIRTVDYRYIMTGTPEPNHLTDLWAQIWLLDEGERLGATFGAFTDKYFRARGNGMIVYEYIPRPGAAKTIAHKIHDIALTMQTGDYVQLPTLLVEDIELDFSPQERDAYERLTREYVVEFFDGGPDVIANNAGDLTNKLLQLSSGAVYEDEKREPRPFRVLNTVKLDALRKLLEDYPDENFIVVYWFKHEVTRILSAFPFARAFRSGKHSATDFSDWNAGKIRLLLIHPDSAGHGLNLQHGGRRMVCFTTTWKFGKYLQTVARIHRRGVTRDVYVHRLIVRGTRDERVRKRLSSKDSDQRFLMDEIKDLRQKYYGKQ